MIINKSVHVGSTSPVFIVFITIICLLVISVMGLSEEAEKAPELIPFRVEDGFLGRDEIYTKEVLDLINKGLPSVDDNLLTRLAEGDAATRQQSEAILKGVFSRAFGFEFGVGWPSDKAHKMWVAYNSNIINYRWSDNIKKRREAAARLRALFLKK